MTKRKRPAGLNCCQPAPGLDTDACFWRQNGDQTAAGTANPFFNGSAFFRGYGKELSDVLVDMSRAAAGTSHIAFFVLCQGENDFEGLLAIFAEEFIARHGDLQKRSRDTMHSTPCRPTHCTKSGASSFCAESPRSGRRVRRWEQRFHCDSRFQNGKRQRASGVYLAA